MKKIKYTKELLEDNARKSKTKKEFLINLGLRAAGENYKTLNNYINIFNIDISHFVSQELRNEILRKNGMKKEIPLKNILVEKSNYNRNSLKNRLYREGLKERKCELCGQGEKWNGKKMSLIIDHINGIHDDNRLENLRIVCPNCNATLETHCGKKNKKKHNFCISCGVEINKKSRKCHNCNNKQNKQKTKFEITKEELEKLISKYPYTEIAKKYGVSDVSIKKRAIKLGIKVDNRLGYWTKTKYKEMGT